MCSRHPSDTSAAVVVPICLYVDLSVHVSSVVVVNDVRMERVRMGAEPINSLCTLWFDRCDPAVFRWLCRILTASCDVLYRVV
jgi:hypothetical protein